MRTEPGSGYWGTGSDLGKKRKNKDKAKEHHKKEQTKGDKDNGD